MSAYMAYLKKNILTVITCIVLLASVFIVYTVFAIPNKYDATAVITTDTSASSYIKVIKSEGYIDDVSKQYSLSKDEIINSLDINGNGHMLTLRSRTTDAMTSKKIVDCLVTRLIKYHPQITVKQNATVAAHPSSPSLLVNGALGGLCGLIVGLVIIGIQMKRNGKDQA